MLLIVFQIISNSSFRVYGASGATINEIDTDELPTETSLEDNLIYTAFGPAAIYSRIWLGFFYSISFSDDDSVVLFDEEIEGRLFVYDCIALRNISWVNPF